MGGNLVLLGRNGRRAGTALPVLLRTRGRVVVTETWPPERLIGFAVEHRAGAVVLFGPLSSGALRAVSEAVERRPEFSAIVVGPLEPNIEVLIAFASGFSAYLPAGSGPVAVADAVDAVLAGRMVLPRASAMPLVEHLRAGGRGMSVQRLDGSAVELTGREWEVLLLLRHVWSTAEIAARLWVSRVTVRTHVAVLVHKLGVADRAALMAPPSTKALGKTNAKGSGIERVGRYGFGQWGQGPAGRRASPLTQKGNAHDSCFAVPAADARACVCVGDLGWGLCGPCCESGPGAGTDGCDGHQGLSDRAGRRSVHDRRHGDLHATFENEGFFSASMSR